ncbi:methylenetetrahydrofolate dehydrogenase (NADP+)/methenyltetrahydrofolate cyclohydrolase [Catalinimonas alkaloidigena]|uniref:bifunctional 5,10-methylenetetrahydrofolate dehydrogenase/5,10-methenyltetrahydrofolate cyclohydrolase n=1 Tax=Catalinimonas alkaloidigena TaxID=1075417 RepID=UPI0024061E21|nr:tetrahydrofolate dehydrogenase/cyclohydrolase catalytic domain-containing protein [Catalinimonas alkaloidigena]MDF9796219.1 methylenetetrahydrofolate dehydrogenase (NADP+)/methenyltetrahydrofolate cyclohydrolase [Catalinimonas alkaloidigena]
MNLIDGKQTAQQIRQELAEEVEKIKKEGGKIPHLAAILVGEDPASDTYVRMKVKDCEQIGYKSTLIRYDADISEEELLAKVEEINNDDDIDGLIVQLPLPDHIAAEKITFAIRPEKDVDGFHPINIGRMAKGLAAYVCATPHGVLELIKRYEIPTEGKHCVVVGRSDIVGTPVSILMSRKAYPGNATVTVCHSRTPNIPEITKQADILIAALGKPEFITADMVKEGAVVIDVGTSRVQDSSKKSGFGLKGDVKFDEVAEKCSYITPVPGGVGPMTRASLLYNTMLAAKGEVY